MFSLEKSLFKDELLDEIISNLRHGDKFPSPKSGGKSPKSTSGDGIVTPPLRLRPKRTKQMGDKLVTPRRTSTPRLSLRDKVICPRQSLIRQARTMSQVDRLMSRKRLPAKILRSFRLLASINRSHLVMLNSCMNCSSKPCLIMGDYLKLLKTSTNLMHLPLVLRRLESLVLLVRILQVVHRPRNPRVNTM